jgi:hypothetical protein
MNNGYSGSVTVILACLTVLACNNVCPGEDAIKYHPGRIIPAPDERQTNLIPNASFECGVDGWGSAELGVPHGWYGVLNGLFGRLDETTAFDGRVSLKIELAPETMPVAYNDYLHTDRHPIKAPLAGTVGWIAVRPGQAYTFSIAMKAAEDGTPARLVVRQFRQAPFSKLVRLSIDWRRYSIEFTPTAEACYVLAGPDLGEAQNNPNPPDQATIWLDAAQLAFSDAKSFFATRLPVELGIATDKPGNIFTEEESLRIRLTAASSDTKEQHQAEIDLRMTDFFDKEVWHDVKTVAIPAKSSRELIVTVPPSPQRRGYLLLHATMTSGTTVQKTQRRLACIPVYTAADSRFGLNHAFGWPEMLTLSRQAGLIWMRDWSMKWQDVEPQKGQFHFEETDAQINRILRENLKVLEVLAFSSSLWSTSAPASIPVNDPWYLASSDAPDPETQYDDILAESGSKIARLGYAPRDINEFKDYVSRTVAHNKDRVGAWQVFNEPYYTGTALPRHAGYGAADYMRHVEAFVQAARQSDPGCLILGGYSIPNERDTDCLAEQLRFIAAGGLKPIDVFTLHTYPASRPPEYLEEYLHRVNAAMDEHGRKPIWFTECAYYADDDPWLTRVNAQDNDLWPGYYLASERVQAEYLVRMTVMMLAHGVEKIFFHAGTGSALNHGNLWTMFLRYGGEPFKCYATQAVMSQLFTPDCTFVRPLLPDEPIKAYLFDDGKRTIGVVWTPEGTAAKPIRLADPKLQLWDLVGRRVESQTFTPGETPVYIIGQGVSAEQFEKTVAVVR